MNITEKIQTIMGSKDNIPSLPIIYLGSADLFSSADGENRSFLSHPTLISKNPNIFRDYSDDFHHFNKGIKKFPEELHYIFHEVARANP